MSRPFCCKSLNWSDEAGGLQLRAQKFNLKRKERKSLSSAGKVLFRDLISFFTSWGRQPPRDGQSLQFILFELVGMTFEMTQINGISVKVVWLLLLHSRQTCRVMIIKPSLGSNEVASPTNTVGKIKHWELIDSLKCHIMIWYNHIPADQLLTFEMIFITWEEQRNVCSASFEKIFAE